MSNIIILSICLALSLAINIVLIWYIKETFKRLNDVIEHIKEFVVLMSNYKQHLKSVYELDMFYGDEVLHKLMEHTTALNGWLEDLSDFKYIEGIDIESESITEQEEV